MTDRDNKLIRNSTAEFRIFTTQAGEQSIEARYEDETVWLTQINIQIMIFKCIRGGRFSCLSYAFPA